MSLLDTLHSIDSPDITGSILAIDLAERHSGIVWLSREAEVLWEYTVDVGPRNKEQPHVHLTALGNERTLWMALRAVAEAGGRVLVEDIPPHLINPKPVLRLQGLLLHYFGLHDVPYELVNAAVWQRELGYKKVKGRTSKGWAKELCEQLGYKPDTVGKQTVDLRDAYLLGRWAHGWRP